MVHACLMIMRTTYVLDRGQCVACMADDDDYIACVPDQDDDPYVRKTAAVCVAKLYDINPELVEDRGFLDLLKVFCFPLCRGVSSFLLHVPAGVAAACMRGSGLFRLHRPVRDVQVAMIAFC